VAIDIPAELMTSPVMFRYKGEGSVVASLNRSHVSNSIVGSIVDLVGLTLKISGQQLAWLPIRHPWPRPLDLDVRTHSLNDGDLVGAILY
jgi:hypothetical protein